jgi:hypothetical protein
MKKIMIGLSRRALACLIDVRDAINKRMYDELSRIANDFYKLDEREITTILEASINCKQNPR